MQYLAEMDYAAIAVAAGIFHQLLMLFSKPRVTELIQSIL